MLNKKKLCLILSLTVCGYPKIFGKFNFANSSSTITLKTGSQLNLNTKMSGIDGLVILPDNLATTVTGVDSNALMYFTGGSLKTANTTAILNTIVDPTSTDTIALANGDLMDVRSGTMVQAITVANGATATILGQPLFSSAISLGNAASVLQLGIITPLNQNITGAGTVKLLSDLIIQKNVTLPSLINLNNSRLVLYGGTYSTTTISGSGIIDLVGKTTLSNAWTIGSGSYTIVGNGNVLDFGTTGGILFNGTDLTLSDLVIKNLSSNRLAGTGEIKLTNVTIELSGNYTRADGAITIFGANCKLITNGYTFVMSGAGHDLTIDGAYFFYEQLNSSFTSSPISIASGALVTKLNGGDICQILPPSAGIGSIPVSITASSTTLDRNYPITSAATFTLVNFTTITPKAMSIDGGGHWLDLPFKSGSYLVLNDNVQATFSNLVLKNFYPAAISVGTSATITYSDGVRLELGPDLTIASGDAAWTFNGNAEIDGNGATLNINKSQGITITGAKTLTLKNMRIVTSTADALKCLTSTAKIKLQNVDLILTADFSFSQGSLDVVDLVRVFGDTGSGTTKINFEFSSAGSMSITNSAELFVGFGVNLKYNADTTGDPANNTAAKRHLSLARQGSKLTLQGCSLQTTNTGLALDTGSLQIYDKVSLVTTTAAGAEFEFGPNLQINLAAGAVLDVDGKAIHKCV